MINKQAVLEHIAEATQKSISEVEKAVSVEYWKNIVDFTSLEGVDLFADYLKSQEIKGDSCLMKKVVQQTKIIFK